MACVTPMSTSSTALASRNVAVPPERHTTKSSRSSLAKDTSPRTTSLNVTVRPAGMRKRAASPGRSDVPATGWLSASHR